MGSFSLSKRAAARLDWALRHGKVSRADVAAVTRWRTRKPEQRDRIEAPGCCPCCLRRIAAEHARPRDLLCGPCRDHPREQRAKNCPYVLGGSGAYALQHIGEVYTDGSPYEGGDTADGT